MRSAVWCALAAMLVTAVACQHDQSASVSRFQGTDDGTEAAGASPIENYKNQVLSEAMRGLDYQTGRVRIDPESDRVVTGTGDRTRALQCFAEAEDLLYQQNMLIPAISRYTEAVINAPDEPVLLEGLARALMTKGKKVEAEAAFLTALDLDPDFIEARHNLGSLYYGFGEYAAAIDAWQSVLRLDPEHVTTHERLAVAEYYRGDYQGAANHVAAAEEGGATLPPQFLRLLEQAMGEGDL